MIRKTYEIFGIVQGVGFRPFVYKTAFSLGLSGFVKNTSSGVEIEVQGALENINDFENELQNDLPPLARIDAINVKDTKLIEDDNLFEIRDSYDDNNNTTLVSTDIAVCDDCLDDIRHTTFKNYFATNCTNCGPRYSIIKNLPYDRKNTSMSKFEMCGDCKALYTDPNDRRYHAQPIACENCGPKLDAEIKTVAEYIKNAKIVAIKGIGGFHIVCDATNDEVLRRLRYFKNRPAKPFAIMCKDLEQIESLASLKDKERELLLSKERPIIILDKKQNSKISKFIAPSIERIGCMIPYTPLQHLLFEHLDTPIVATSANLGGEPIITTKEEIEKKLSFVDFVLDFDRDIVNAVDDSIVQIVASDIQTLRLARGYAPKVIKLAKKIDKKILAVGANQKNTISLAFEDTVILSPYIGDLDSLASVEFFERTIETFKRFYNFIPDVIVHDKHPNYESSKWAKKQNIRLYGVSHHLAHIYACKAEYGLSGEYIGLSFDGTGYGDDETLWGGEVFVADERKYHFRPIKLLGGEISVKEPKRIALSMLFDRYELDEVLKLDLASVKEFSDAQIKLLYQSYVKDINTPKSSSVGRLFDAVASFADLLHIQSYEGEAGLMCESVYNTDVKDIFSYVIDNKEIDIKFDFFDKEIISKFINTLIEIIMEIAKKEELDVILSGGVFQNKIFLELLADRFERENIKYYYQKQTPINDGAISLGQIYYVLEHLNAL